jgi:hypothetical protein
VKPNPISQASPAKKAKIQQLIWTEMGFHIPLERASFGVPQDVGNGITGETVISMRSDPSFDERFSRPDQGVTYTRLNLQQYLNDNNVRITVDAMPVLASTVVAQINQQVPIPLDPSDYVNTFIEDPTLTSLPLQAHAQSLLWWGSAQVALARSIQKPLLMEFSLGTFPVYQE